MHLDESPPRLSPQCPELNGVGALLLQALEKDRPSLLALSPQGMAAIYQVLALSSSWVRSPSRMRIPPTISPIPSLSGAFRLVGSQY